MNENLLIALIGLGGAIFGAFLTAVLQPLLTKWIMPKASLTVSVRHSRFQIPRLIEHSIQEYIRTSAPKVQLKEPARSIFHSVSYYKGYCELLIENNSSKAIGSVSLALSNEGSFVFELAADGKETNSGYSTFCEVGTIRAKSKYIVRLWTFSDNGDQFFYKRDEFIKITADEIDSIEIVDHLPRYISENYMVVPKSTTRRFWSYLNFIPVVAVASIAYYILSS